MSKLKIRGLVAATTLLAGCATAQSAKPIGAVTCSIEPERTVLAANTPESMVVKVALNGVTAAARQRASVNLAIVIDRSGSMSGSKIERAKEAAIAAIDRLDERDVVTVVVFDNTVQTLIPAQRVTDKTRIANTIRTIQPGGSTAIFAGVSQAASEIRKFNDTGRVNRILLLSDGQANVGPASPAELGRLGVSLMKEGVSVSTIGLGLDYNEDLMTQLATKSDGNTYFVENSDNLPRIFNAELGDVLSVVAKDVKLHVRFKNGARPIELIGRDGRIDGNIVTIDFNQLYGNHQKFVLIRTEFTPGEVRETREFAEATVDYRTLDNSTLQKLTTSSRVTFSRDAATVRESANTSVIRDTVLNVNAVELEKAIKLSDAGKFEEAAAITLGNVRRAGEARERYNVVGMDREEASQSGFAKRVARPMAAAERKEATTDLNMMINQQQALPDVEPSDFNFDEP